MAAGGWAGNAVAADCMATAAGDPTLNCTANDFAVSAITVTNVIDGCSFVGDTFTFDGKFGVASGSTTRYDIGFYVGRDGVQAYTGTCYVTTIPITGGFANLDGDQCGDYDGSAFLLPVTNVTTACVDSDRDGFFDVAICESWDNNTVPNCQGPEDAVPSTKAKCNCQQVDTNLATPRCASNADCTTDNNSCTNEVCNALGSGLGDDFGCSHVNNTAPCNDGKFCTLNDTCSGGTCSATSGSPCAGADGDGNCAESCNESTDTCSASDPNGSACNDGQFCTVGDQCLSGICTGTARVCGDGNACTTDSCNEASDICSFVANTASCDDGLYCTTGDTCSAGTCSGAPRNCGDGNVCTTDSCNETTNICVNAANTASCDDGLYCTLTSTCSGGTCSNHTGSPCAGADGDGNCAESCNESTDTCGASDANGSPCNDGLFCTVSDQCVSGVCTGTARVCSDSNTCTNDSCNEASDICSFVANTASCNDGLYCTTGDTCSGGACTGAARNCGDGNVCTTDSCNESTDACVNATNTAPCDDGLFCTLADTCSGGTCSGGAGNPCAGPDGDGNCAESCNESTDTCVASDPNGSPCNDGQYCTVSDQCLSGICTGAARNCGDANVCTDDACDEAGDTCSHVSNTAPCSDLLYCTTGDVCSGGTCSGAARDCADGNVCTTDSCNEAGDTCVTTPNTEPCDDGEFCTLVDTCSGGTCSNHTGDPCIGPDGDGDCTETCNEATNACDASDLNGSPCEDGQYCTIDDQCAGGVCTGAARDCADLDVCTQDLCDEDVDSCAYVHNTASCDDGLFCTDGDVCGNGVCAGPPRDCEDGLVCTTGSCDEDGGVCVQTNNTEACDDGLFCTEGDACADGICSGLEPLDCADSTVCTDDSCDEDANSCVHAPNTVSCDDSIFCNGDDTCSAGACGHAGDPCPGVDEDENCAETCDEEANNCNGFDVDNSLCNDGLFCNGGPDRCDDGVCSVHPGFPCDDDNFCTGDSCDEDLDTCSSEPVTNGTVCDDEDICTIEDECVNGSCGGHETALMDLCPWIIVERQGIKRDTVKIGSRADIGGDVCGGLVRIGNVTIIDGDLASASTAGPRQVRISPDAFITEDVVSAGAGAKARPGVTKLPQLAIPVSALAPGSLTEKTHAPNTPVYFYDLRGTHPLADDCTDARNTMPDVMALLDSLPSEVGYPTIRLKSFQSLLFEAYDPGGVNVIDVVQIKTGRNVTIELDGGGDPNTVMVIRVAKKMMVRLQSTIVLSGGLLPENTLFYVKGRRCTFGDLMDGSGTVLCSTGRLKTGRTITWLGTFYGAGKILKIGDTNVLTYSPFRGF